MTSRLFRYRVIAALLILILAFNSCRKDETEKKLSRLVSEELLTSYTESYISSLLTAASKLFDGGLDLSPFVQSGSKLYKVIYQTTINGEKINASGLACVPDKSGDYPVISFQNGTNTLHSNAPTEEPSDYGFQIIEAIASMGYVVVIADYPGFGESSEIPHPYLVAEPSVRSIIDMLYAVREMDEKDLPDISVNDDLYLMGYSQGGWATLQIHKAVETRYADDFDLKASCAGAGPYNIYLLMEQIFSQESFPMPYYIGYVINGYKAYNQFINPVSDLLNEPYASRLGGLFNGQNNSGQINAQLTTSIPELITSEFLEGFATDPKFATVKQAMIDNSIEPWKTKTPLLLIHGDADTHVFPSATEDMYEGMLQAGTSTSVIKKIIIPGADHSDAVVPAMLQGFLFINNIKNSD